MAGRNLMTYRLRRIAGGASRRPPETRCWCGTVLRTANPGYWCGPCQRKIDKQVMYRKWKDQ